MVTYVSYLECTTISTTEEIRDSFILLSLVPITLNNIICMIPQFKEFDMKYEKLK